MSDFIELRQVAAMIMWRWRLIVLSVVLGGALGFFISRGLPPVYEATASVLVGQSIQATNLSNNDIQVGEYLAVTYAELGRRQPVLEGAVQELGLDVSWQQLRRQVRISVVEDTQLLEIAVESTSPVEARLLADAIVHKMIQLSPTAAASPQEAESRLFLEARLESLRQRIEEGQQRIEELEAEMTGRRTAAELSSLQSEIDSLEQMITGWESNYAQLSALLQGKDTVNYLTLIEPAEVRSRPVRPRTGLNTLLGVMLGLALAVGFTFVREYADDTVRSTDDLEQGLGLSSLGAVSPIAGEGDQGKLITAQGPFSPASEAFNVIRSNIRFLSGAKAPGVILVTSAMIGEGKSLTAANLGLAMARSGVRTVVVDADLRRPTQHKIFDVPNECGVAEFLASPEREPDSFVRAQAARSLWLVTSGKEPDNPSELLSSDAMELFLASLVEKFEMVILDGPPVLTAADAAIMSSMADAVVMVVHCGRTGHREGRRTVMALQQAGATILGAVLNHAPPSSRSYYYSPYGAGEPAPGKRFNSLWWLASPGSWKSEPGRNARVTANDQHGAESISDARK